VDVQIVEQIGEGVEIDKRGSRNFHTEGLAIGREVHDQPLRSRVAPDGLGAAGVRQMEIRREGFALSKRNFEVGTLHDFTVLSTVGAFS
jgi:hypothetical protein